MPKIPINLNPVYIASKVNIGCIPILLLTSFGSNNCLTTKIIIYKPNREKAKLLFIFKNSIIIQGTNTVPAPSIGSASINPISSAIKNGYSTFMP